VASRRGLPYTKPCLSPFGEDVTLLDRTPPDNQVLIFQIFLCAMLMTLGLLSVKLRRLVIASTDPDLWAEKRADEGELVVVESRQLEGIYCNGRRGVRGVCERGLLTSGTSEDCQTKL
jgi:hypothetical protein